MEIVENWSRIHGRVEAWQAPRKAGEPGTLTMVVEKVDDVASPDGVRHRNLLIDAAGTTMQVMVPASVAASFTPRKGATAVVDVRRGKTPDRVFAHPQRIIVSNE